MIWIWLWTLAACEAGDLAAIIAKAKAHNVGVMVKTHDGATQNPNGTRGLLLVEALRAAGVPVRAWGYCYPDIDVDLQAAFASLADVDYIADVEVEWDGRAAEAQRLVSALRRELPVHRLGYAPLPIVSFHDGAGQYEAFNRLDVACPQAYAGTGGRSAIGALEWTEQEWEDAFARCNVEPAVYAADQSAEDLRAALRFVTGMGRKFGNGDASIWSWQHMADEHWSVVDEFTKEDSTVEDEEFLEKTTRFITPTLVAMKEAYDPLVAFARENGKLDADQEAAIARIDEALGPGGVKLIVEAQSGVKDEALKPRPTDPPSPAP